MVNQIFVHTLGDSVLDNLIWMMNPGSNVQDAQELSVEGQLDHELNPPGGPRQYTVISHAYDGFTTRSVLGQDTVGRVLHGRSTYSDYMITKTGRSEPSQVRPLDELEVSIQKDSGATHYVALSVGGNDFRENLFKPWNFIKEIPAIQKRYLQIIERINQFNNIRPIILLQYRTDTTDDVYGVYQLLGYIGRIAAVVHGVCISVLGLTVTALLAKVISTPAAIAIGTFSVLLGAATHYIVPLNVSVDILRSKKEPGLAVIGSLIKKFFAPVIAQAHKDKIPLLDLSNTFNPRDGTLYVSGIEPSKAGGALIAEGIAHVIENHNYEQQSKIYTKWNTEDDYTGKDNDGGSGWEVVYPSTPFH